MKKLIFLLLVTISINAQTTWKNYTYTNNITVIEKIGDYWWIGTLGGLVKFNDSTNKSIVYNRGNSEILSNHIVDLVTDENDNIWIATYYGISKFDGSRFTNYDTTNSGLLSNNIKLIEYENGIGVWVVTDSALTFFDGTNWTNYREDDEGNSLNNVTSIFPASPYGILYGASSKVKFLHHDGSFGDMQYPGGNVTSVLYDLLNNVVVSTIDGYWTNENDTWTHYDQYNTPLPVSHIYKMEIDSKVSGDIYFGLYQHGLGVLHYDGTWSIIPDQDGSELNYLSTFYVGDELGLGLAQMHDGFVVGEHPSEWEYNFSNTYNISTSPLHSIEVQNIKIKDEIKYIASRGIDVLNENDLLIKTYDGLQSGALQLTNPTKYLDVDIFDRIWCSDGINSDIVKIENGNVSILTSDSLGIGPAFNAMQWENLNVTQTDTIGKLWINVKSTSNPGIGWLDTSGWHAFPDIHPTYPFSFEQFISGQNGIKWFAGMDGIFSYDGNIFTLLSDAPINIASCVIQDKQGNIWFGGVPNESYGYSGGLAKYDGINWTLYTSSNSELLDDHITTLALDNLGNIFVGSMHGGMTLIDTNFVWTTFTRDNSPFDNNFIKKIAVDRQNNNIWILNSNAGVFIYNEDGIVNVEHTHIEIPNNYELSQNFPNPFNPQTNIKYQLAGRTDVNLTVYNIMGQKVRTLIDKRQKAGKYSIIFNASDLASGIYFYRLLITGNNDNFIQVRKMIFLK